MTDGQVDISLKISELESRLPDRQFIQYHRAFIVNMAFMQNICRYELQLSGGTNLPVRKYRYMAVKEKLIAYLKS